MTGVGSTGTDLIKIAWHVQPEPAACAQGCFGTGIQRRLANCMAVFLALCRIDQQQLPPQSCCMLAMCKNDQHIGGQHPCASIQIEG